MPSSLPPSRTRSQAASRRAHPQHLHPPAAQHTEPMQKSLYLLLSLLPGLASAQSSQPTSEASSLPSSQPKSQPSSQASQPSSKPKEDSESLEPTAEELIPALPLLPPVPLVLRGLPAPVKNVRIGLHVDHIVFRGIPGQGNDDLTSFETVT